jgi:hypothetical protein
MRPTKANEGQRRPKKAKQGPTKANKGQQRPTKANKGQQRPTKANKGQWRPTKANKSQQKPTKPNAIHDHLGTVHIICVFIKSYCCLPLGKQTFLAYIMASFCSKKLFICLTKKNLGDIFQLNNPAVFAFCTVWNVNVTPLIALKDSALAKPLVELQEKKNLAKLVVVPSNVSLVFFDIAQEEICA